ncbi:MAG: FtsH protease activity modulator HflK [Gammaproteobacteria bacterium]|jgi:membrane protease subunit HflK|nr:FtsH protease activity modulator HflK [Gammaproteobacteria bacterium]
MAWNDSGNGKDPWNKDDDQPNDLDKIVQGWQRKLSGVLGGGKGSASQGTGSSYVLLVMLVLGWLLTGLYRVDQAERGVVQRFGEYTITSMPGLRWRVPFPVDNVDIVNVEEVNDYRFRTEMLTADEQYVFIDMVVQYRRNDPVAFSFNVEDPELTLQDVTESALRGVVGTSSLELLIGERREQIPARTMEELQQTLEGYGAGIMVTSINLSVVDYPNSVREAVDDTQKARNDKERIELEARTYSNDIIPRARGAAQRVLQDAGGYHDRVIADASGEASRFEAMLTEYQKAPRVTRDRLYLDAIEEVYGNSNKVIIDSEGSGNMIYLPLDQLVRSQNSRVPGSETNRAADAQTPEVLGNPEIDPDGVRERVRRDPR